MKRMKVIMNNRVICTLLCSMMLAVLPSCNGDDAPQPTPVSFTDFATVVTSGEGQDTQLDIQRTPSSPVVRLRSSQTLEGAKAGQRIVVCWQASPADTVLRPVPAVIRSAAAIPYCKVKAYSMDEIRRLNQVSYKVLSAARVGDYLNMQLTVQSNARDTRFAMVADEATLEQETVDCYLVGENLPENGAYVNRRTYASFDVSGIAPRPGQQVRLCNIDQTDQ